MHTLSPVPARDLINLLCYLCALKLVNEPGLNVIMKCRSRHPHAMKSLPETEHGVVIERRPPHPGEFVLASLLPPVRPGVAGRIN